MKVQDTKSYFLRHLLAREMVSEGSLSDNPLAHAVFRILSESSKEITYKTFAGLKETSAYRVPGETIERLAAPLDPSDLRLTAVGLSSIRRFGIPDGGGLYTLDFARRDGNAPEPISTIILGDNGIGKSTVFNSLEFLYTSDCPSRNKNSVDESKSFLKKAGGVEKSRLMLKTGNSVIDFDSPKKFPKCFFCTEEDMRTLLREGSIEKYIYGQLGFLEAYELLKSLEYAVEFISKTKVLIKVKYHGWPDSKIDRKSFCSGNHKVKINDDKIEVRFADYFSISDSKSKDKWLEYAQKFREVLHSALSDEIKKNYEQIIKPIFDTLFEKFMPSENKTKLVLTLDNLSMKAIVKVNDEETRLMDYLNNFRMMMFAVSLKVALAICAGKIYNINMPIVIDDVFNSSDFQNRLQLRKYMHSLIKACQEKDSDHPIQLIIFTQDSLIADMVYQGISRGANSIPAKLVRIFPEKYAEKIGEDSKDTKSLPLVEGEKGFLYSLEKVLAQNFN